MKQFFFGFLQWLARLYLRRHQPLLIGITGSVGKTSSRYIIAQVIDKMLPDVTVSTSPKNFNSQVGLPLAILEIEQFEPTRGSALKAILTGIVRAFGPKRYDVAVLEYGIDQEGDMDRLLDVAVPEIAMFTTLDKVHAYQLGGPDEILAEKSKLLLSAKELVVYPIDGEYLGSYLAMIDVDSLSYSLHEDIAHDADIGFTSYRLDMRGDEIVAKIDLQQGVEHISTLTSNMIGRTEAGYTSLGVDLAMILQRRLGVDLATDHQQDDNWQLHLELQPGRSTPLWARHGHLLIDSSYNAAPASMHHMIKTAINIRQELFPDSELVYCLGDMRELGDFTESEHRQLAAIVAQSADRVYLVGESMHTYLADELIKLGYNANNIEKFTSSTELGTHLADQLATMPTSIFLFKGSQNTIFLEEAIKPLLVNEDHILKLPRQSSRWLAQKGVA